MALKSKVSYLMTALIILFVITFILNYRHVHLIPKLEFGFSNAFNSVIPELAIRLHPELHNQRKPETLRLRWEVTQGYRSPDGVRKLVYLINGAFPGPTVEGRSGDRVVIDLQNRLEDEGIAFHWHGIHMRDANAMDGAVGITQKPILPGDNFTYDFKVEDDQTGTFWYHSHSGLQRADGLYGGLIIHSSSLDHHEKYDQEAESLLMIGDLYHRPAQEVQAGYVNHDSWGREPVPDSILVNGRGKFNCSMAVKSRPLQCEHVPAPQLTLPIGRSRVRVVNTGAMSGFILHLPSCQMSVVEVDGGNAIEPSSPSSSVGIIYPGERLDMIIECDAKPASSLIITLDPENFAIPNPALTQTHSFPLSISPTRLAKRGHSYQPPSIIPSEGFFDLSNATGLTLPYAIPEIPSQAIVVYTKMEVLAHLGNVPAGFLNRTSWAPQSTPPRPLIDLDRAQYDRNQLVPRIPIQEGGQGKWVDIVVNNLDDKGHPFHLHGYDFLILTSYTPPRRGYHAYNPFTTEPSKSPGGAYNLINPPKKDTVYIPSQGYVVLRIKADNAGIWFFHCHVLWHSGAGMGMALEVDYV